jgi:DNA-binding transcriptional LysR family regulator
LSPIITPGGSEVDFELRQVRQLIAIVEAGSYRAAANRLHIAQPALSVSITKLERAVGAVLLIRDSKGARLTESGTAFLRDARHALALADQSAMNARLTAAGDAGTVRLGFVASAVYQLLPAILPVFRERHRAILLELSEGATSELTQSVKDQQLDCAIVRGPIQTSPELEVVELERDRLMALLPADHQFADEKELDLSVLSEAPFVLFSSRTVPRLRAAVDEACARAGFVPHAAQEVTQSFTMLGLVGSGLGVALSPSVIANISGPRVRFVPLIVQEESWPLKLLGIKRRGSSSRALDQLWGCLTHQARTRLSGESTAGNRLIVPAE